MPDDVFRIIVAVGVGIAALAFVAQAVAALRVMGIARGLAQKFDRFAQQAEPALNRVGPTLEKAGVVMEKIGPVADKLTPAVQKIGPLVDHAERVLATGEKTIEDIRPRVTDVSNEVLAIAREGREQAERLGDLLHDAAERAHTRLEQIDETVTTTVEQVEIVGESVKRAVMRPVREVNGLAAGLSAVVATLVRGSRRSSVDSATQDEELFI
jgi:ABC-type transporter Mla subunit MlaD